ncbi:hypothetical protein BpHYR1_000957 [Brachionus plicatilis]|uniref:Uncharacterized protein n=1 Tax=Brachionus plicatilis TaxID=10195 RepID=A0A3M7RCY2_BRAPC|nr:hypothetical protein BpHYR1_000957 [Brachionus plicatilis]
MNINSPFQPQQKNYWYKGKKIDNNIWIIKNIMSFLYSSINELAHAFKNVIILKRTDKTSIVISFLLLRDGIK